MNIFWRQTIEKSCSKFFSGTSGISYCSKTCSSRPGLSIAPTPDRFGHVQAMKDITEKRWIPDAPEALLKKKRTFGQHIYPQAWYIKILRIFQYARRAASRCPCRGIRVLIWKKFSIQVEKILNWSFQRSEASKALKSRLCSFCELPAWWKTSQGALLIKTESFQRYETSKVVKRGLWLVFHQAGSS